jgi:FlaA1/EpsC-like NDP-sugar epimerase
MSLDSEALKKASALEAGFPLEVTGSAGRTDGDSPPRGAQHWRPSSAAIRLRSFIYPVIFDALCISTSFALVAIARGVFFTETTWIFVLALVLPSYLLVALNGKVYSIRLLSEPWPAVGRTLRAYLIALALMTLAGFYLKTSDIFPRLTVAFASVLSVFLLTASRYYFVRHRRAIVGGEPYSLDLGARTARARHRFLGQDRSGRLRRSRPS